MRALNIICANSYCIRKDYPLRRFFVQIEFEDSITDIFVKKFLEILENTFTGISGEQIMYFFKVNVKGYCLMPDGKKLLISLAPKTIDRYDKHCLMLQIKDVLSLMKIECNLNKKA